MKRLIITLFGIVTMFACNEEEPEVNGFSFSESFSQIMPDLQTYHSVLKKNSLNVGVSSMELYGSTMSQFEHKLVSIPSHYNAKVSEEIVNEIQEYLNYEDDFTSLEISIYNDMLISINNVNEFDYKNHYIKLSNYLDNSSLPKKDRERLELMKETFDLAMMIDPSSYKDLLKDSGESIVKSSIVGGLFGAVSGLYHGCKTGLILGFNPGSAAAGCMGGLIAGTIGGLIVGAAEGAAACAIF